MRYVVSYDVSSDALRARLAALLGRYGSRVQESVFECSLEPKELESLTAELRRMLESEKQASVRLYRLCADCLGHSYGIGAVVIPEESRPWLVI